VKKKRKVATPVFAISQAAEKVAMVILSPGDFYRND